MQRIGSREREEAVKEIGQCSCGQEAMVKYQRGEKWAGKRIDSRGVFL